MNEPAFPCEMPGEWRGKAGPSRIRYPGMSLRDYFAAAVLQGLCGNPGIREDVRFADMAWRIADEMLKLRDAASSEERKA